MARAKTSEIDFGYRFEAKPRERAAPHARATPIGARAGYGTISYKIGDDRSKREDLKRAITALSDSLPAKFGNTAGTYTITINVMDMTGKELARAPILTFQWQTQRVFFFIDKIVDRLQSTGWSGTLVDQTLLTDSTRRLRVGVTVSQSSERSMDFDSLQKTAKMFTEGALVSLLPLPASTLGVITSVGELVNLFYAGSKKATLVETEEYSFTDEEQTYASPISFKYNSRTKTWTTTPMIGGGVTPAPESSRPQTSQTQMTLPITIIMSCNESRFMSGKFDPGNVSVNIVDEKTYTIATAKDQVTKASLIELLRSSDDYQEVRTLLDRLASGKPYTEPDLSIRCAALYGAFSNFLSRVDARALFWAFVKRNDGLIDRQVALGGGRGEELAAVGLGG